VVLHRAHHVTRRRQRGRSFAVSRRGTWGCTRTYCASGSGTRRRTARRHFRARAGCELRPISLHSCNGTFGRKALKTG